MCLIKTPVRYDPAGAMIFDVDGHLIVDIRGWGRLQYLENGAEIQDKIGEFIAMAINEKSQKEKDNKSLN